MKTSFQFTRQELYDLVWEKPMTRASEDLGISDVGLKKICHRNDVPVPPRGYWAKLAAGKKVVQEALPEEEADPGYKIRITSTRKSDLSEAVSGVEAAARDREQQPENQIEVGTGREPETKMGVWLKLRLAKQKANGKGLKVIRSPQCFPVEVREESIDRAIAIIDALTTAFDQRGLQIARGEETAVLQIAGETISFGLHEVVKRKKHVHTDEEKAKLVEFDRKETPRNWNSRNWERRWEYERTIPEFDYHSEGKLYLEIGENAYSGMRCKWGDAKIQRVEKLLNDFIAHLEPHAVQKRERHEEQERWARERAEAEQRRTEAAERKRLREKRLKFVDEYRDWLDEADRLERIVGHLEGSMAAEDEGELPEFSAMMQWCRDEAKRLRGRVAPEQIEADIAHWYGSFVCDR